MSIVSAIKYLVNHSGGLGYHWRAQKSKKLWEDHSSCVNQFLESFWEKLKVSSSYSQHGVILVGPSGGYSLNASWFLHFENILCIDPDPVAKLLFSKRFQKLAGPKIFWASEALGWSHPKEMQKQINRICIRHSWITSNTPIVFCNLLGQLDVSREEFLASLKLIVQDRPWASYHDWLMDAKLLDTGLIEPKVMLAARLNAEKLALAKEVMTLNPEMNVSVLALDEVARSSLNERETYFSYWNWSLTPSRNHIVEGIMQLPVRSTENSKS